MIVFKNYADIIKKQFPIVLIYGAVIILLVMVLSNTTQEKTFTGYEQTKVRIAVFNDDKEGKISEELLAYLEKYCEIVSVEESRQHQLDALYFRNVYYILTIPEGFSASFLTGESVSLKINAVNATQEANYVNQAVNAYLDYVTLYHKLHPEESEEQLLERVNASLEESVEVVEASGTTVDRVEEESADENYYYNLLGFILLACILVVICTAMGAYRKEHIYIRHIVSPLSPMSLNLQLLLGNIAYSYLYTILFLALGIALGNERSLSIRTVLYWCNTFAYVTSVLFFAYFIAYRFRNRMLMNIIANTVAFVLALISGIFIRQEYLSEKLVKVSSITPVYWFVRGNDMIMKFKDYNLKEIITFAEVIGIQLLFAAAFFSLVLVSTKLDDVRK